MILMFLRSASGTKEAMSSNSGRYIGFSRTSLLLHTNVSPGLDAGDSKNALISGTYILKISRGGSSILTMPVRLLWLQ